MGIEWVISHKTKISPGPRGGRSSGWRRNKHAKTKEATETRRRGSLHEGLTEDTCRRNTRLRGSTVEERYVKVTLEKTAA